MQKRETDTSSFFSSPLLPYLLAALFSVHSLIAGFALGVNSSLDRTAIATTVAIFSHKVRMPPAATVYNT
jgi:zinc transporter ZupT